MRRLINSRDNLPDEGALEGFPTLALEGDLPSASLDAIGSLRPFGRDITEQRVAAVPASGPASPGELVRAAALAASGRRLDAIALLRQVIAADPKATEARISLANLHGTAGDWDLAIDQLSEALARGAAKAPTLVLRGAFHAQANQADAAERDFREAVQQDPSYWPAYRYLGVTRLRQGAGREAIRILRDARSMAPQDPECALFLGEALLAQGELDEGHQVLSAALDLDPRDPRAYLLLGRLLDRLGRTDEAMVMHRKAHDGTTE